MEYSLNAKSVDLWTSDPADASQKISGHERRPDSLPMARIFSVRPERRPERRSDEPPVRSGYREESRNELSRWHMPVSPRFSRDERVAAVRAAKAPKVNATMIAQVLGIDPTRVHSWRRAIKQDKLAPDDEAQVDQIIERLLLAAAGLKTHRRRP